MNTNRGTAAPVVVVGAAGFIGRALCARLATRGVPVIAVARHSTDLTAPIDIRVMGRIGADTQWEPILAGAGAIVHLATRAHAPVDARGGEAWIEEDAAAAAHLAATGRRAGVARIVVLSSIKVHGEASGPLPFRANMAPSPADAYGRAKWRIEEAVRAAASGGPALTVLRPPLVYGPGVKANFLALLRLVDRGLPLPLASIDNRRSLVFLGNLLDVIERALSGPAAPGTFLLRDDVEPSTPDLICRIARHLGRPARLLPCPPTLLRRLAAMAGHGEAAARLIGSVRIDDASTRAALGWQPRFGLDDGLAETCRWFRSTEVSSHPRSPV